MTLPIGLRRFAYRWGHVTLRAYWFLRRPDVLGVKCVLRRGGQILLVRHTYGRRDWDLPGGKVRRGEPPREAARREMKEELGVEIDDWTSLGCVLRLVHHRRDHMHCFMVELDDPVLSIDRGELATVGWFNRGELPPDLVDHVPSILARVDERREHAK